VDRDAFRNFGAMPFVVFLVRFSARFVGFVCARHRAAKQACPVCRKAMRQATGGTHRGASGSFLA
jgi:hypothetical protein